MFYRHGFILNSNQSIEISSLVEVILERTVNAYIYFVSEMRFVIL